MTDSGSNSTGGVRLVRVPDDRDGQRLDNFLLGQLKGAPRSIVYKIVRSGQVRVNGGRAKAERKLEAGDEVRIPPVRLETPGEGGVPPKGLLAAMDASIVFEDGRLLAISKPSGIASHGGSGITFGVIETLRALRPNQSLELIHRLDRDTSGLMVLAKKRSALSELQALLREDHGAGIRKRYLTLLAGRMPVRQDLAKEAIGRLAERLGLDVMATAQGIIKVVTANMARAIRVISVQRGHDPRDYTLVAFGGAGPLHAARLAKELDISRILVPLTPGILCATGLLLTDLRADFASTRLAVLDEASLPLMRGAFAGLETQAGSWFEAEGIAPEARRLKRTVDMRYAGQNYELSIPLPEGEIGQATLDALAEGFAAAHRQRYGFVAEGETVQLVTYRVEATGLVRKAAFQPQPEEGPDASAARTGEREVWMPEAGGWTPCPIYDRAKLRPGNIVQGPAIIEQMDTTTVVLPAMAARVEPYLNLILEAA